jgi:nitrate reductase delta subunit
MRLAARALAYPEGGHARWLRALAGRLAHHRGLPGADALARFAYVVASLEDTDLCAAYVAAFDLSPDTSPYLTHHEHADERRRGLGLWALKARIEAAGFALPAGELPDHLPALLEFDAVAGRAPVDPLDGRLRAVADRLAARLAARQSPYADVFEAVAAALPVAPAPLADDGAVATQRRREAEEVPFPLEIR